jgi:hypothetical protein
VIGLLFNELNSVVVGGFEDGVFAFELLVALLELVQVVMGFTFSGVGVLQFFLFGGDVVVCDFCFVLQRLL